ncbi:hypothetical protein JYQ78_17580 [Anaerobutyricum hallii]|uniref:hypothetical protein n=1 Tax=Anaerobutyricum hallii TaxID=39488 RepID=UPI001ADDC152|nr:hypothetical protein [Anaerobutyricum hallii]MBP0064980.1 hypothetical protein [Anaerobutyricum hallii]
MIKYRPHRGSLAEAMNEMKIFNSKEDMFKAIVINWNGFISYEDLSISEDSGKDNRIDWKETRYVCTKRIGDEVYDVLQCIGMCFIED